MDPNTYEPKYLYLKEIYISELVFDDGDGLSLFCYLKDHHSNKFVRWDFFANFNQLTDILLTCGEKGEKLIEVLSERLQQELDYPTIINVERQLDSLLEVDQLVLKVYPPCEKDESGNWKSTNDNCLFIEALQEKGAFHIENPSAYISFCKKGIIISELLEDAISRIVMDPVQEELDDLMLTLNSCYESYKMLLEQDFSEKKARKRAGLKDELLFKIATLNNKLYKEL